MQTQCFGFVICRRGYVQWLSADRHVLEHDLPKNQEPLVLYFQVRYVAKKIPVTILLLYSNLKDVLNNRYWLIWKQFVMLIVIDGCLFIFDILIWLFVGFTSNRLHSYRTVQPSSCFISKLNSAYLRYIIA